MAVDERIANLIQWFLDGVASENERAELHQAVASDPEVARAFQRARGVTKEFKRRDGQDQEKRSSL